MKKLLYLGPLIILLVFSLKAQAALWGSAMHAEGSLIAGQPVVSNA